MSINDNNNTDHAVDPARSSGASPPDNKEEALALTKLAISVTREMLPHDGMCGEDIGSSAWKDRLNHELPHVDPRALESAVREVFEDIYRWEGFSVLDEDEAPSKDLVARVAACIEYLAEDEGVFDYMPRRRAAK